MAKTTKPKEQLDKTIWTEFNGITDSFWQGIKGSLYKCVGLDIHSQRGSVTPQQRLAKDSGTTITDLCNVGLDVSDNSRLWFSYTTGKIWRESAGTYTLVYTTVPTTGTTGCYGAKEFNGNIYWGTQNYLHYIAVVNIGSAASWTTNAVPNWKLFGVTDSLWHPMAVANAALYIGDGNQVAKVDSSNTFTANILNLIAPIRIKCMIAYDIDLVMGTFIGASINYSHVIEWDTVQTTWQFMEFVWENGVNSLFWDGTTLLANAGQYGKIYYYTGHQLKPFKRIPGTSWTPTSNGEILPNASAMYNGRCLLGFSTDNGNPADQAVYSLGSYDKDYTVVLNEEFPISSGNFTNITIGVVLSSGSNIYVAWQDTTGGGSQGVDKLDFSNLYASAYCETPVITRDYDGKEFTTYERFFAHYKSLPANTSIAFSYYADWGAKTTPINSVLTETVHQSIFIDSEGIDARVIRMRLDFTVSGNSGPVLESFGVTHAN